MTDHTPEPWDKLKEIEDRLDAGDDDILGNDRAVLIEQVRTLLDLCAMYTEDLKRAKACMAACAGIPTEQLRDGCLNELIACLALVVHMEVPPDKIWKRAEAALASFRKD